MSDCPEDVSPPTDVPVLSVEDSLVEVFSVDVLVVSVEVSSVVFSSGEVRPSCSDFSDNPPVSSVDVAPDGTSPEVDPPVSSVVNVSCSGAGEPERLVYTKYPPTPSTMAITTGTAIFVIIEYMSAFGAVPVVPDGTSDGVSD